MIYTVTLNPAIDYTVYTDKLLRGEINRSNGERFFFGGKGINVSNVLKNLGIESVSRGFTAGFTGRAIEEYLADRGIKSDFVHLKEGFTRINIKLREGVETDINTSGPLIEGEYINRLFEKIDRLCEGDYLVLSGSVPKSMPSDTYGTILERVAKKGVRAVVDAEGDLLARSVRYNPFLIKPNTDELGKLFGITVDGVDTAEKYARKLKDTGAENVLVSMGEKGALLIDSEGKRHYSSAHSGKTVNTVGAGDSMVAGFIAGFEKYKHYGQALRLGTAAGSATAFCEGLADGEQIYRLFDGPVA